MNNKISYRAAPPTLRLDLLTHQEGDQWIAHCVQLDLVASGGSETEAFDRAQEICIQQIIHAMATDNLGKLFRPPNGELLGQMFRARTLGYLHIELDKQAGTHPILDLEFQRLLAA